jgi:hypothetical protein
VLVFGTLIYKCFCACRPNLSDNQRPSEFPLFYFPPGPTGRVREGGEIGNTIVVKNRSSSSDMH